MTLLRSLIGEHVSIVLQLLFHAALNANDVDAAINIIGGRGDQHLAGTARSMGVEVVG